MKNEMHRHQIDGVFVLLLFTMYAAMVLLVLYFGVHSYQGLVDRDEASFEEHLGTAYISSKIKGADIDEGVAVGGFTRVDNPDQIQTLYLYQTIDGESYVTRLYYYEGYLRELFTAGEDQVSPGDGNKVMEAKGLTFHQKGNRVEICVKNARGEEDRLVSMVRTGREVTP